MAEIDGEVVGYAYGSRHHDRAAYRWSADVTVYISAAHHRRGVGRALYGALFELLERQGIYEVCAGVTLPNDPSVGLHESLGFRPVGVYRDVAFKFGAVVQRRLVADEPAAAPRRPAARRARAAGSPADQRDQ